MNSGLQSGQETLNRVISRYSPGLVSYLAETERMAAKVSQYRNLRVVTLVPEMTQGLLQHTILTLVKEARQCSTSNDYSQRTKNYFVPFVYQQEIYPSLIICEPRQMNAYSAISSQLGLKHLFVSSARQAKNITIYELNDCDLVVTQSLFVKDLARTLSHVVREQPTNYEQTEYQNLIAGLISSGSAGRLINVLSQINTPGKYPTFVTAEAVCEGPVFYRVFVDPSSLNALKHETIGKFLWIFTCSPEFSPTQHSGVFWKTIRKFLPNRQSIHEVNVRFDRLVVAMEQEEITTRPVYFYFYAKKKTKLPARSLPPRIAVSQFINDYEITHYDIHTPQLFHAAQTDLYLRFIRHAWLTKNSSLLQQILPTRISDLCPICFADDVPVHSVLLPCCVQAICFSCFYIMLKQGLKCPTCRMPYASEGAFQLLSLVSKVHIPNHQLLPPRHLLLKDIYQSRLSYYAVIDADEPVAISLYKIAQALCGSSQGPLVICIEQDSNVVPELVIPRIINSI